MSHAVGFSRRLCGLLTIGATMALLGGVARAQDRDLGGGVKAKLVRATPRPPERFRGNRAADVRSLTINKRPENAPSEDFDDGENSATVDGPTRYNSISTFDPVPYVDSGIQYPYGLDGIGGYGSDVGLRAGQDTALYQRGP